MQRICENTDYLLYGNKGLLCGLDLKTEGSS